MTEDENNVYVDTTYNEDGDGASTEDTTNADNSDVQAELEKARQLAENYRIRAEKAEAKAKKAPREQSFDPDEFRKQTEATVREQFEVQYLEELEYPDDIKEEMKKVAKLSNISVRQAEKDPYVQYKIQQAVQEQRLDEAAIRGTKKSETTKSESKALNPKDFDLNTAEGRQAWQEAKAKRAT